MTQPTQKQGRPKTALCQGDEDDPNYWGSDEAQLIDNIPGSRADKDVNRTVTSDDVSIRNVNSHQPIPKEVVKQALGHIRTAAHYYRDNDEKMGDYESSLAKECLENSRAQAYEQGREDERKRCIEIVKDWRPISPWPGTPNYSVDMFPELGTVDGILAEIESLKPQSAPKELEERLYLMLKTYDASPDEKAGFEMHIVQPVKFREDLKYLVHAFLSEQRNHILDQVVEMVGENDTCHCKYDGQGQLLGLCWRCFERELPGSHIDSDQIRKKVHEILKINYKHQCTGYLQASYDLCRLIEAELGSAFQQGIATGCQKGREELARELRHFLQIPSEEEEK